MWFIISACGAGDTSSSPYFSSSPRRSVAAYRDEFHPMVTELGWDAALTRYLDTEDKMAFYRGFESFMRAPRETLMAVLREIQP